MSSSSSAVSEFSRPNPMDGYYDIFISFRGEDTRFGFTDNLYHLLLENEIYTFIDVDLVGKGIESLFKIIGTSRMAVVVYSENFASSHWCLKELEMIMQLWEEKKMMMIPIFYKIGVNEVKHPNEKTTKYFDQHITAHGETKVEKWKDVVIKLGSVSGFPYRDIYSRSERDFITQVVIPPIKKQLREWEESRLESTSSKPHNNNSGHETEYHDVFISFMGRDTRYGLVNDLYKGLTKMRDDIKTFMHDDRDPSKDDNLIFEVIERSTMLVVVFSENYASSKRCLKDLVKILHSKTTGQEVLPIFYEVNPSDLINQETKGSRIAYHLEKHASDEESDTVQTWRDAIVALGYMVGWRYSIANSQTAAFIEDFIREISTIRNRFDEKKESARHLQARAVQRNEEINAFIDSVSKNIGFSHGRTIGAITIYKRLLNWKSFEAEKTSVFDRLVQMIGSAIERDEQNNDHMAYWLSNTSALFCLLQKSFEAPGSTSANKPPPSLRSLLRRMKLRHGFWSPPSANLAASASTIVRQVEAKYPALLFKQQLTEKVENVCGIIRDNLKKDLSSFLSLCIEAPITSKGSVVRSNFKDPPSCYWQSIIESLNTLLRALKENFVPTILVRKIYEHSFSFINMQLFNSLLLYRECCTLSNGEYVRSGLVELELWCVEATEEYAGSSWEKLKHITQAILFLVKDEKYRISYDELINDLCSILNVHQLYRLCTLYKDDSYNTRSVSVEVISSLRVLKTEESNNANPFLLDDSSNIPFSMDDISNSLPEWYWEE